jgi:uncharacterized protein (DUF1800 family)
MNAICTIRARSAVAISLAIAACASPPSTTPVPSTAPRDLTRAQQAAHVLNRLAFGARPGETERVMTVGVDRWIAAQLQPETIRDSTLDLVLESLPAWSASPRALNDSFPQQDVFFRSLRRRRGLADNAQLQLTVDDSAELKLLNAGATRASNQFQAAKVIRAQLSERQLLEVMTDFWENHFSVFAGKMPSRFSLLEYDRDVIRAHALSKFRDLLGAVAHSPAMLWYLDNYQSVTDSLHMSLLEYRQMAKTGKRPVNHRRAGLNENYARELLELHTLGVDGGYTQHDVIEVARALTGWGLDVPREGGGFMFRDGAHDAEPKVVLGHDLAAGRGVEDGEDVLDIVARHPATAHYIAFKLARHLVSDTPDVALVKRAAETFRRTDGDIREVVRTIVTSPEFFSRANYRAKVKSPFELVVSARRLINASPDTSLRSVQTIARLGEPLFGHLAPNGWPETGDQWINAGSLLDRINFGVQVGGGKLPYAPIEQWPPWALLSTMPFERQMDEVVAKILGGDVSPETRLQLAGGRSQLRDLLGMALGSPEFQRR